MRAVSNFDMSTIKRLRGSTSRVRHPSDVDRRQLPSRGFEEVLPVKNGFNRSRSSASLRMALSELFQRAESKR
eukprot:3823107-Amphidinium_carterae.1